MQTASVAGRRRNSKYKADFFVFPFYFHTFVYFTLKMTGDMKRIMDFSYEYYESIANMSAEDQALVREAETAAQTANARYSNFKVGAAARLESGLTLHASNFESEVYPAGLCAERSLLFYLQANYADDPIRTLAIASDPSARECYPCGQCRQVIVDVERRQGSPIRVIMSGGGTASVVDTAQKLLPFTFILD